MLKLHCSGQGNYDRGRSGNGRLQLCVTEADGSSVIQR